jgi:hypothetical protein
VLFDIVLNWIPVENSARMEHQSQVHNRNPVLLVEETGLPGENH